MPAVSPFEFIVPLLMFPLGYNNVLSPFFFKKRKKKTENKNILIPFTNNLLVMTFIIIIS